MMSVRQRLLLVLWVAGAVSVACNVLAAESTTVGRAVAAWPPVALLLVVEVLTRSPLPSGRLRWVAAVGAGVVAVVAAVASFSHMHEVAAAAGESRLVAWLFPLTVDGLAVVASVALLGITENKDQHDELAPSQLELDPMPTVRSSGGRTFAEQRPEPDGAQPIEDWDLEPGHRVSLRSEPLSPAGWSVLTGPSSPAPPGVGSVALNGSKPIH